MKLRRILATIKIQYINLIRSPAPLCMILLLPIVLVLLFSLMFGSVIIEGVGMSVFEFLIPGLYAFSGLFMAVPVSLSFSEDREQGLLKRINTTPMTGTEFIGSHLLSNMTMSLIQVAIIAFLAFLMGYRGAPEGIILAFVFMVIFSMSTIGFGLITATIAKSAKAAGGIIQIFVLPQQLLASGLYPLPSEVKVVSMFMPLHYVSDALTLLFSDVPLNDIRIWNDLLILIIFSLVIISIGILLFKKYGKT
ncbi:MAG: ABC transporter permease [Candidatus Hermodarchaeota archaeon]